MSARHQRSRRRTIALALILLPAAAGGQDGRGASLPPLVQEVTVVGADRLPESGLLDRIATRPTRCRGLLLYPICMFTDGAVVTERHRLDDEEVRRDELRLRVIYFREGFRSAAAASEVREVDDGVEVRFHVDEGPPTLVESFAVEQVRPVLRRRAVEAIDLPGEGAPLSLTTLADGIEELQELLGELGYLDARVEDAIEISPETGQARVTVEIDPGPRSIVRSFDIVGNSEVANNTIRRAVLMEEGDVVTAPLLRQSRSALHASNLFHEVDVRVPPGQTDSAKVVRIAVREAPPRLARVGGGFNTLEFVQLEGRFTHYNWLGGGRQLDLRAAVGNLLAPQLTGRLFFRNILPGELAGVDEGPFRVPTWQFSADFQQPAFRGTANRLGLGVFANRRVIPGVAVDQGFGAELSATRTLAFRVPASVTYRYEVASIEAGAVFYCVNFGICDPVVVESLRGRRSLSPVTLSFHVDRSDDPLGPTSGYRMRVDFEHASGPTGSDFRYNRTSGQASYYLPLWGPPRHVLAARIRAGWVRPLAGTAEAIGLDEDDEALLHPRKRFYAGGARSVRGYAENQLGPRILTVPLEVLTEEGRCAPAEVADGTCDPAVAPVGAFVPRPIGGTSVLEANVEYRFPVGGTTLAVFVDGALVGGRLGEFVQDAVGTVTPGFGARFDSPAGPIRIDLGVQPRSAVRLPVVTEAEPAEEPGQRRLVRLDEALRFDPLEERSRLGRILGRLTLHFSIGEAF